MKLFSAVLILIPGGEKNLTREHCLSTVNQQHVLSEHSPSIGSGPRKTRLCFPIITGIGPGEVRRGGKTLCSFRSGSFCVSLAPKKKAQSSGCASCRSCLLPVPGTGRKALNFLPEQPQVFPTRPCLLSHMMEENAQDEGLGREYHS